MTNRRPRCPSRLAALDRTVARLLADGNPARSHIRRPAASTDRTRGDEGFALLESLVAIVLISVIMAAFTTFFVNSVASTTLQRAGQIATQVANSTVDTIRAIPSSDLVKGRDASTVTAQFSAAPSMVASWLSTSAQQAVDTTALTGSGATAAVPTTPVTQTIGSVSYRINTYLSYCAVPLAATTNANCTPSTSAVSGYLRAVVAVTWTGTHCPPNLCTYVTSTVVSTVDDPLFSVNQSPPAAPTISGGGTIGIANQTNVIGDTVNLTPLVAAVPTYRVALTAGTLPAGLTLNTATGAITGIASALTPSTPLTLTVTDGFGRVSSVSFTWTVVPGLTVTTPAPANQAAAVGTAITAVQISAAGGSPGYTWSYGQGTALPPGLALATANNQASITGTPTAVGTYPVTLTVTDTQNRTATISFTWTVVAALKVNPPGDQSSINATAIAPVQVSATGGSPGYTWSDPGRTLPTGLSLSTVNNQATITGTPTAVGTFPVTLTVTDTQSRTATVSFTWTVAPVITVTAPANQAAVVGTAVTAVQISASGGTPGYTWSDPNRTLPAGLVLATSNNQARITGTPTSAGTFAVVLTVTDTQNRTGTVSFTWTVDYPPFSATNPGAQKSTVSQADSLTLAATGGSGSFAWTGGATLPAGLTLTAAGLISGTPTVIGTTTVTLMVTDTKALNPVQRTVQFSWTVSARPSVTSPGNQSVTVGLQVTLPLTTTCPNGPCSYAFMNGPATFAISSSGVITGTVTSSAQTFNNVTVTVTDSAGATVPSASFTVIVNPALTISNPGDQTAPIGTPDSLNVASLVSGGTPALNYSASNLPSWLTLNSSTGMITGTAPATVSTTTGIVLTVSDAVGVSASTPPFSWIVSGSAPSAPLAVVVTNADNKVTASWNAPATTNGAAVTGYQATLSPGGASCTTTTALTCAISGLTNGIVYALTVTATNSLGTGPASTAVRAIPYPAGVMSGSNMTLWLDAADPTVLLGSSGCTGSTSTTAIGCWKDKSGQTENFSQTTAANRPGITTWNGLPAANFADTTDVLNSDDALDKYQTVFVAANLTTSNTYNYLFGQGGGADLSVRVGPTIPRSVPNGQDWSYNSGNPPHNWYNGEQATTKGQSGSMITTDESASPLTIAASISSTFSNAGEPRGVVGQIGEVITFKTVLTTAQRHAVEDYLAHKWAVPIKPSAPQSVSVVNGSSAVTPSWTAPATGLASSYTATATPGGASCTTTALSCTIAGMTNGVAFTVAVTASNDFGTGPASAAVAAAPYPAVMTAANGMTLWLDGSDPGVLYSSPTCTGALATGTGAIGCWKDKSGSGPGENFTQTTATAQPAVGTWNGRSAANFADPARVLNSVDANDSYQTVFFAANVTNPAGPSTIVDLFGRAGQDFNVRIGSTITRPTPFPNYDWSSGASAAGLPANWANGAQAITANQPIAVITTDQSTSPLSFAASVSNTFQNRGVVGQVGDVITFNRVLTTAERRSVEEYLATKWGVVITPSAPAAISAAKASATSAAVTWTASTTTGGATVTGYTVKSSGGQTCATTGTLSCTVPGLTTGTAYTFTVTATNSAGIGPASAASGTVTPS